MNYKLSGGHPIGDCHDDINKLLYNGILLPYREVQNSQYQDQWQQYF